MLRVEFRSKRVNFSYDKESTVFSVRVNDITILFVNQIIKKKKKSKFNKLIIICINIHILKLKLKTSITPINKILKVPS